MPPGDDFGLRVWINAGNVLFEMGRVQDALEAYDNAARYRPAEPHVLPWMQGQCLVQQGRRLQEAG